ncbi:MAG TPA: AtpZ/AtpI family protein [Candidatus Limnocylindrales bacterium]
MTPEEGGRGADETARDRRAETTPPVAPERGNDSERSPANWGIALDLGMRLGISVILGLGAGLLVDGWLRTSPVFTLLGVVLGVAAAMYTIWDVAREAMRR